MTDKKNIMNAALAKAQAEFADIPKNRPARIVTDKGTYSYKYADLADVLKAVTKPLNDNGLFISQKTVIVWGENGQANLVLHTVLMHESGESLESEWPLALQQRPQQTGALLSYYRRYALCSLLGIQAEEMEDQVEQDHSAGTQGDKPVRRHSGQIPMNGKRTKTELKAWVHEFVAELHACSDVDQLDQLVNDSDEMIAAVQKDLSNHWWGDDRNPDYEPVPARIARLRRELVEAAEGGEPELPV